MSNTFFRRRLSPRSGIIPGDAPGTLRPIVGSASATAILMSFKSGVCSMPQEISLDELPDPFGGDATYWVRICGLGDVNALIKIGDYYGLNKLMIEDILSLSWRSRLERNENGVFFVLQSPPVVMGGAQGEHLCLFCKENIVVTFEERPTQLIDKLWQRLEYHPPSAVQQHRAGYLTYAAIDFIVDRFFPLLDTKDMELAELEDSLNQAIPGQIELQRLHLIKRELLTIRRLSAPYREIGQTLLSDKLEELRPYINDLNDHITQAEELITSYHEIARSLDDIYQSAQSNRMNDIMKTLTIISTVFMPLSFIASLYGMNFDSNHPYNMPELKTPYGYPFVLCVMIFVVVGMFWLFRRKKWL